MELVSLVCLFVVAWTGIASADGPTVVKQVEKEDGDAVLNCSFGKNAQGKVFDWRKDGDTEVLMHTSDGRPQPGLLFKGRVSHFPEALQSGNASILIKGMKVSDNGSYTCDFPFDPPKTRAIISLFVEKILKDRSPEKIPGAAPKPVVAILRRTESGVLLQCEVLGAFPQPDVEWQDSAGTVLQAEQPQVTSRADGKYDIILKITVTKSDNFSCISTQKDIHHQIHAQTFVQPIGAVKPSVTIIEETNEWVLLECEVYGVSPKTKLQWKDSFNNVIPAQEPEVIERGGSSDIILQTTVTKSDYYHCVATQEETGLQTEKKIHINIGGFPYGWVIGPVLGFAVFGGIIWVLKCIGIIQCNKKGESGEPDDKTVAPQKSPSRDII